MVAPTPLPPTSPAPATRPGGVLALGILAILASLFWGFLAVAAYVASWVVGGVVGGAEGATAGAAIGGLFAILFVALGLVALVSGIGLLMRKRWGWYLALVWAALQVLQGLASLVGLEVFSALTGLAIGGLVAWYLLSPRVQAWFGVQHRTPWSDRSTM